MLYIEDCDGDESLEGIYESVDLAKLQAEFIYEWDPTIRNHRISEDLVRDKEYLF